MPVVSIVTAVHGPSRPFLPAAGESVRRQQLPDGWIWQWVVQGDGVPVDVPTDPQISARSGRAGSAAVARTLALGRTTGTLIKVLDADDQLLPGALARDIAALDRYPDAGWAGSAALDLLPDGTTVAVDAGTGGPISRGALLNAWRDNDFVPTIHPATVCLRRGLLLALGGWPALPASEDTGLLLAASATSPGVYIAEPGLLYRKWPGQSTGQPAHTDPAERAARVAVIAERAASLRGVVLWPPPAGVEARD
jgi:hypothetical protein